MSLLYITWCRTLDTFVSVSFKTHMWKLFPTGTVALITINSGAQIHPLIATRWCSSLKGKNLRYVMVANHGYLPDKVNFAARIAKNRVNPDVPLDLIASFKAAAQTDPGGCR